MKEGDSHKHEKQDSDSLSHISNFFQSFRIRRSFRTDNEMDRFLLDYGFNFLPSFSAVLWIIFFIF